MSTLSSLELTTFFTHIVENAFLAAEQGKSKVTPHILQMEGMSGNKTRHFYNNLLSHDNISYLEIGVWKGSSTCAAMCNNEARVVAIDNWSECGVAKDEFLAHFAQYKGKNDALFIEKDCFTVNETDLQLKGKKFNIYMYDGPHQEHQHYKALHHFYPFLESMFIFIVDDWNWPFVRHGTMQSIDDLGLKIKYQKEIRITQDDSVSHDRMGWWNGICVFILEK